MNKLNFKLKLNKVYERNFKTRKKIWEIKKILNEVEKEHNENYESIDIYLKSGDKSYEIKSISAFIFMNKKKC